MALTRGMPLIRLALCACTARGDDPPGVIQDSRRRDRSRSATRTKCADLGSASSTQATWLAGRGRLPPEVGGDKESVPSDTLAP
jgi:hypothetical protein